jgi:hypothetical protein
MQRCGAPEASPDTHVRGCAELLRKGFPLAYFIIGDRDDAIEIISAAFSKLKVEHLREKKRFYWRDKALKDRIYRVVRSEADMFQWLIYVESGQYEKLREGSGRATLGDLVVWYIKHLIQTASAKSAFYVNVAIQRLLYGYYTTEAQTSYEWLTEHYDGPEMYRKAKRILMSAVEKRFGPRLTSCTGSHGERRFEASANQESLAGLVEQTLKAFVPWSTIGSCPASESLGFGSRSGFLASGRTNVTQDLLELRRCHIFIDPDCYARLTEGTGLDSPAERLMVPQFSNYEDGTGGGNGRESFRRPPTDLTDEDMERIVSRAAEDRALRERLSPQLLVILVDGEECARMDVTGPVERCECRLEEGANLLEVATEFKGRRLTLALHWIEYTFSGDLVTNRTVIDLGHGRELSIVIERTDNTEAGSAAAWLRLVCRQTWSLAALTDFVRTSIPHLYGPAKLVSTVALFIAIGWFANSLRSKREIEKLKKSGAVEKITEYPGDSLHRGAASYPPRYRLVPDDVIDRSADIVATGSSITIPAHEDVIILELPVPARDAFYRAVLKTYLSNMEILSEDSLRRRPDEKEILVEFVIPRVLLTSGHLYSVELYSNRLKRPQKVRTFTFSVVMN